MKNWILSILKMRLAVAVAVAISLVTIADAGVNPKTFGPKPSKTGSVNGQFVSDGVPIDEFHCVPKTSGKHPVVLLLHGCAPNKFGSREFSQMCSSLAERGYYAMFIEYYGPAGAPNCRDLAMVPSFSLAPEKPLPDDVWTRELSAARTSLAKNPKADSSRLGLIGFSFGGTLAVISATLNPDLPVAIVDYYGFSNTRVEDAVERAGNFPPTLILQGDADSRAHVVDSIHLHNAITKQQKASEIRVYPGVGHGFNFREAPDYDEEASEDAWARTLSFLDRHLK
jgi:carboxymethylenebutenolidase